MRSSWLSSKEGEYDLTLTERKGFIREALLSGASLIPCFGFGETDIYKIEENAGQTVLKAQQWMKSKLGFTIPLFSGRFGPVPHRMKITVVVGEILRPPPLPEKFDVKSPEGQELLDDFHESYCRAVRAIWKRHKGKAGKNLRGTLKFGGESCNRLTTIVRDSRGSSAVQ
eukprot:gnl/TRDRNA2_/TRDRNA2_94901_c0_seq1.p2 gnl/TRDRNA2_/TRDRNA2_94901_c0~~gnl/TRDRNA2_/TRDRNA2_94901_c0_seq1.p2  ORF type:complete len:170 (+),score=23.83 gnl/TRDRNA2_/TRDRNA2_94901_c0_seq1:335-844(+)